MNEQKILSEIENLKRLQNSLKNQCRTTEDFFECNSLFNGETAFIVHSEGESSIECWGKANGRLKIYLNGALAEEINAFGAFYATVSCEEKIYKVSFECEGANFIESVKCKIKNADFIEYPKRFFINGTQENLIQTTRKDGKVIVCDGGGEYEQNLNFAQGVKMGSDTIIVGADGNQIIISSLASQQLASIETDGQIDFISAQPCENTLVIAYLIGGTLSVILLQNDGNGITETEHFTNLEYDVNGVLVVKNATEPTIVYEKKSRVFAMRARTSNNYKLQRKGE